MLKDKLLMTSFFVAALVDILTTGVGLNLGTFREIGWIGSQQVGAGTPMNAMVFRMAVTAFMVGMYALTKERGHKPLVYSFEKAVATTNLLSWSVVFFNAFQIGLYVASLHS